MENQLYGLSKEDVALLRRLLQWWRQHKSNILTTDSLRRWWPVRGGGGGASLTLAAVSTAPDSSDIYYKVKKVVGGAVTGAEFHAFIQTDPDHMGYSVYDFDHVFAKDEMCFVSEADLGGGKEWFIVGNRSYVGSNGSIKYDTTDKRLMAVFASPE